MNPSNPCANSAPTVLIAEDDAFARAAMLDALAPQHACVAFADAESLLADPALATAGCVLSDIRMGGLSGIDLQAHLADSYPWIPVLLVTGHAEVDMAVAAMKNGAFDFIQKPVVADTLRERVAAALEIERMAPVE